MQKKLIALAIAGALTAPLAAQAEVKLSGVLQAELVSVSSDDVRADGLYMQDASTHDTGAVNANGDKTNGENGHNAGSLAFTASEDLGNGLKGIAKFALNTSINGLTADRDAYVGLSGGFGTVLAGRMNTPYKSLNWDPLNGTFMQARGNFGATAGLFGHGSYLNDAIAYANTFGTVKVVAAVGIDEAIDQETTVAGTDTQGNHAMSFSVVAPLGPVELGVAYIDASEYGNNNAGTGPTADDRDAAKVAARFKTGAISILAQYEMRGAGAQGGATADGETFVLLNGAYTMGNTMLSVGVGQNTQTFTGGAADLDNTYLAVGAIHKFSKTTRVHAGYKTSSRDTGATELDEDIFGVGMRVAF